MKKLQFNWCAMTTAPPIAHFTLIVLARIGRLFQVPREFGHVTPKIVLIGHPENQEIKQKCFKTKKAD